MESAGSSHHHIFSFENPSITERLIGQEGVKKIYDHAVQDEVLGDASSGAGSEDVDFLVDSRLKETRVRLVCFVGVLCTASKRSSIAIKPLDYAERDVLRPEDLDPRCIRQPGR